MTPKARVYTKVGDTGMTMLAGGGKVPKTHMRIEAYGTVDELNAHIGFLLTRVREKLTRETLYYVQDRLFAIGAHLATRQGAECRAERITTEDIARMEETIDIIDDALPPLRSFVIPGGCPSSAMAHICRTVCRRAERAINRVAEKEPVDGNILAYINRLSDLLFIIARNENCLNSNEKIYTGGAPKQQPPAPPAPPTAEEE